LGEKGNKEVDGRGIRATERRPAREGMILLKANLKPSVTRENE
jgi:hypothetical protein